MKVRRLVLCMMLSLALVVTFIPVISFAGNDVSKGAAAQDSDYESDEAAEAPTVAKAEGVTAKSLEDDWTIEPGPVNERLAEEETVCLYGWVTRLNDDIELEFQWLKGSTPLTEWNDLTEIDEDEDLYDEYYADEIGTYYFVVREKDNPEVTARTTFNIEAFSWKAEAVEDDVVLEGSSKTLEVTVSGTVPDGLVYSWEKYDNNTDTSSIISGADSSTLSVSKPGSYICNICEIDGYDKYYQYVYFRVYDHDNYLTVTINGIVYELNSENDVDGAGVWGYDRDASLSGKVNILSSVKLSNGRTYPVNRIDTTLPKEVTSVDIPASVKKIDGIGYYEDENGDTVAVPGFTIIGKTGSAAQAYAKENGFKFRDLAVEAAARAEAARQGVYNGSMPAVKASKPKAAKKAITVKWKKLKKKQFKSGVSKIEVWVSTNTAFARGATIEKTVGKKKASVKIKGLKKGVTYYAKVRAIKYVNGQKVVGKWSGVKKVKVKK